MTGYPPKCKANGPRHHVVKPGMAIASIPLWEGDTLELASGNVYRYEAAGTLTLVFVAKRAPTAGLFFKRKVA